MSVALGHVASDVGGDAPVQEKRSGRTGYLLLLPAILWLVVFFAIPLARLARGFLDRVFDGRDVQVALEILRFRSPRIDLDAGEPGQAARVIAATSTLS